jgi:hypothetical protein
MRANLGLMATVISTMIFEMILNPPGDVMSIKNNANSSVDYNYSNVMDDGVQLCPRQAVLAATNPDFFCIPSFKYHLFCCITNYKLFSNWFLIL